MLRWLSKYITTSAPNEPQRVPWRFALAWTCAVASLIDVLLGGDFALSAVVAAAGLGTISGVVAGSVIDLLTVMLRRTPVWVSYPAWLVPGVLGGWWLAGELGAFARLEGPYRNLAWITIAAACVGGVVIGASFALLQPSKQHPHGWLRSRRVLLHVARVAWVLGAIAMTYVDRTMFLDLYPSAHLALRVTSLWAIAAVVVSLGPILGFSWRVRASRVLLAVGAIVSWLPFVLVRDGDGPAAARIVHRPLSSMFLRFQRTLTDVDRDGYSSLLGGGDCEPWNKNANPGAVEVADNGIDDNCRYGDRVTIHREDRDEPLPKLDGPAPNIVLITMDAVVFDHMSAYGYERDTTPNVKAFAKDAVVFERAYAAAPWTSLAIPALLRGVYPRRMVWTRVVETSTYRLLRMDQLGKMRKGESKRIMFGLPLEEPRPPFPKRLQEVGYHTMAALDDGYSQFLSKTAHVDEGFSEFLQVDSLPKPERNDLGTTKLALQALRTRPKDKPFMLWIHYFGPHAPSTRHKEVPSFGSSVADLYDHEIRFTDFAMGPVLEELREVADERPLAVFISADHGEILLDKRRAHGSWLDESSLHIPLIVKLPGVKPGHAPAMVSQLDIPVTILRLAGARGSQAMEGVDLHESLPGMDPEPRILHSDTWRNDLNGNAYYDCTSVYDGEYQLVFYRHLNQMQLAKQLDRGLPPKNLKEEMPVPKPLDEAMGAYLEQTGGPPNMHN